MNIEQEVSKILAKRIDISGLKKDDKLSALGLDSLDLVEVMLEIEEVLHIEFDSMEIENIKTLQDVLNLIAAKAK